MTTTYTGWSDADANGILNTWLAAAARSGPAIWYPGLLLTLPSDSTGAGLVEPWVAAPSINTITSVSTGGSINGGTTRYYVATEVNPSGETTGSVEMSYAVPAGTNTNVVTVSWTGSGIAGNTFRLYESGSSGSEGLIASGITTGYYNDTGAASPGSAPPSTNSTGYGYQRPAVTANTTNFPSASGRVITNAAVITFPIPLASWGVPIGVALFDGPQSSANFRACGFLNAPLGPVVGTPPFLPVGAFAIPFN